MKCIVFSPRNGPLRISRFAAVHLESRTEHAPAFDKENELSVAELCSNLEQRRMAPLELTAALQSRLPAS